MLKKWLCEYCGDEFSRRWNMERHLKLIHGGSPSYMMNTGLGGATNKYRFGSTSLGDDLSLSKEFPFSGFSKVSKEIKNMTEFYESLAKANALSLPNIQQLQGLLNVRNAELSDIWSNYWLIHMNKIKGLAVIIAKDVKDSSMNMLKTWAMI